MSPVPLFINSEWSQKLFQLKHAIEKYARDVGFDLCRFTTANPPETAAAFERWIGRGGHGEMGYLERNAAKRKNPQAVLAGAKTIITLAVSYAGKEPANQASAPLRGQIARYA